MKRLWAVTIVILAACDIRQTASAPTTSATASFSPPSATVVRAGTIQTIAGNGTPGYSGDGSPAVAAQLNGPKAVAVDAIGNVYIGEAIGRVRKVAPDGTISTVAGTGTFGFSGDGGPATAAKLTLPSGLAIDGSGNLYIADRYNYRIRRVTRDGIITTVAGTGYAGQAAGTGGYSGDAGIATSARLGPPSGIALDPQGNLYIADEINGRVRKVSADGVIRTVAGPATEGPGGGLSPAGIALDRAGNLYIADNAGLAVWKVAAAGTITRVAGRGFPPGDSGNCTPALSAAFGQALSIALDGHGTIYLADAAKDKVRMVSADGSFSTVAGTGQHGWFGAGLAPGDGGPATAAPLGSPPGIAVDGDGNLYVADEANMRVRKVIAPWQAPITCG